MNTPKPSLHAKAFAEEVSKQLYDKYRDKNWNLSSLTDAVRQMIEYKLANEFWIRLFLQVDKERGRSLRRDA